MNTRGAKSSKSEPNLDLNSRVNKMEETLQTGLEELKKQLSNITGGANSNQAGIGTVHDINAILDKMSIFEKSVKQSLATLKTDIERNTSQMEIQRQDIFNSHLVFHGVKEKKI